MKSEEPTSSHESVTDSMVEEWCGNTGWPVIAGGVQLSAGKPSNAGELENLQLEVGQCFLVFLTYYDSIALLPIPSIMYNRDLKQLKYCSGDGSHVTSLATGKSRIIYTKGLTIVACDGGAWHCVETGYCSVSPH